MDLAWSDATWNKLWARFGMLIKMWKDLDTLWRDWGELDTDLTIYNDQDSQLSALTLNGIVMGGVTTVVGVNTDIDGKVYLTLADSSGTRTVNVYSDVAKSDLIATGNRSGDGVIALGQSGNSGVTGSVTVAYSGDDADIYVVCEQDWRLRVNNEFKDQEDDIDDTMLNLAKSIVLDTATAILTQRNAVAALIDNFIVNWIGKKINSSETSALSTEESVDGGAVSIEFTGILPDLIDAMADEATGSTQDFAAVTSSIGSLTADADNSGAGAYDGTPDPYDFMRNGVITMKCTDQTIGATIFEMEFYDTDEQERFSAANDLTVDEVWQSVDIGIKSLKLKNTWTEDSEDGTGGIFSAQSTVGQTETNSSSGSWLIKYNTAAGGTLSVYKGTVLGDMVDANLVGQKTGMDGELGGAIEVAAYGSSGLTTTATVANTPPADADSCIFHINYWREDEKLYITLSNSDDSDFQEVLRKLYLVEFDTDAAPQISNSYVTRG